MSKFHLVLTPDLSSISVPEGRVTMEELPSGTPPPTRTYDADALAALHSISGKLTDLEYLLQSQMDQLQEMISSVAIDVAQSCAERGRKPGSETRSTVCPTRNRSSETIRSEHRPRPSNMHRTDPPMASRNGKCID